MSCHAVAPTQLAGGSVKGRERRGREALLTEHLDFIWRLLRRVGLSNFDADDACQEVFMTATRKLENIRPGHERTYLYGVALRIAANWKRKQGRRAGDQACCESVLPIDESVLTPEEMIALKDSLDKLLQELPDELWRVIVMAEMCELNLSQIASIEGIPSGTVASRLRRARQLVDVSLVRVAATESRKRETFS